MSGTAFAYGGRVGRGSLRSRAFGRDGLLRQYDWYLILLTLCLTGAGTVLIWAATAPR